MRAFEAIGGMVRRPGGTLLLTCQDGVDVRAAAAAAAAAIGDAVLVALRSDHLSRDEAALVRDTLQSGRSIVLDASQGRSLPAALAAAWQHHAGDPRHTTAPVNPLLTFAPTPGAATPGWLVIVIPQTFAGAEFDEAHRIWINAEDMVRAPAAPGVFQELGRTRVELGVKQLCLLHHRDDPGARHHASVDAIMSGDQPLTWSDLQRLLRAQPDAAMRQILEGFCERGRLTSPQLDVAVEAIHLLQSREEGERLAGSGLAPSIHDVLWDWQRLESLGYLFRGQRDSRWRQDSTLLRPEGDGTPASLQTVVGRLERTQAFLDALAAREQAWCGRALDERERLAIAQHYGFPTPLLDYSRSLGVAAFFATGSGDASKLRQGEVGVIYYLRPSEARSMVPAVGCDLDFAQQAGIRFGSVAVIEPQLPDAENRIARQQGLFIEGFDSRDLQRKASGAIYFRQQPGEAFEDAVLGITRDRLLNPDAELQKLADSIGPSKPRFAALLSGTRLPGDDLFGQLGLFVGANLRKAQRAIDAAARLADELEPGLWGRVRAILEEHFNEARNAARTAGRAAPSELQVGRGGGAMPQVLDEVDSALSQLAQLAGVVPEELCRRAARHRPAIDPSGPHRFNEPMVPDTAAPRARLAYALAQFIVGLEHLRTVRGELAEQYFQNAESVLRA